MNHEEVAIRSRSLWRKRAVFSLGILALLLFSYWFFVVRHACLAVVQVPGGEVRLVKAVEGRLLYREFDPVPVWARSYVPGMNRLIRPRFPANIEIDSEVMFSGNRGPWLVFTAVESTPWPVYDPSLVFERIEIESGGYVYPGFAQMSFAQIAVFRIESIPRRDPQLKMRLFPQKGNPVSMTIDNPFYRTEFPEWTPGSMPVQATRGPFTIELSDIFIANDGAYPLVNCTCTDPSLKPCQVSATLEDPTGNRGPFVSPMESAWKVVVNLSVPNTASSPLNERFPLGKIQIPPAETVVAWPRTVRDDALEFQIRAIAGPGTYEQVKGQWRVVSSPKAGNSNDRVQGPALLCDLFQCGVGNSTIHVQSRYGVRVASISSNSSRMSSMIGFSQDTGEYSCFDLREHSPGEEIELELVRSSMEQFEFLVAPPEKSKALQLPGVRDALCDFESRPSTSSPPRQQGRAQTDHESIPPEPTLMESRLRNAIISCPSDPLLTRRATTGMTPR